MDNEKEQAISTLEALREGRIVTVRLPENAKTTSGERLPGAGSWWTWNAYGAGSCHMAWEAASILADGLRRPA